MKKLSMFVLACSFCTALNAQEEKPERAILVAQPESLVATPQGGSKTITEKTTTISVRAGESQVTHDNQYYQNEITKIDRHIEMIDQKIAFVNSSPEEKQKAIDSGWFDQMDETKADLNAKKTALQAKLN